MQDAQSFDVSKMKAFADEANVFSKQLMGESDRGAALVGAAYLDELLARLFKAKLFDQKISEELLSGYGPLSSFSARINMAYCLGWIGPETYRDLNLLRKIRNEFAHAHAPVTFAHPGVLSRCDELELPKRAIHPGRLAKTRDKFLFAALMLALRLEYYRRDSQEPAAGWDPPVVRHDPSELEDAHEC